MFDKLIRSLDIRFTFPCFWSPAEVKNFRIVGEWRFKKNSAILFGGGGDVGGGSQNINKSMTTTVSKEEKLF